MPKGIKNSIPTGVTLEFVRSLLGYDPRDGFFRWREKTRKLHRQPPGSIAGDVGKWGYREIGFRFQGERIRLKAHRLAWFYMTGEWPTNDVDHKNLKRDDNWFENLRPATRSQNNMNSPPSKANKSGIKGVCWSDRYWKWEVYIKADGEYHYLGRYPTLAEATSVRLAAELKYYGEFSRVA